MAEKNRYGVKKRGTKWIACPWIPGTGRHQWAGTHPTQEAATKAAIAKIDELRRLPANLETVGSFAQRWVRDFPRPKESTNDRYRTDSASFAKQYADHKLHEIDKPAARTWAQAHPHAHAALRAMFADAERDGLILPGSNPFSELRISKGRGRRDIAPITAEELDRLAELALTSQDDERFGQVFRSAILFAAYTGLRPGELFGLDWEDVDFAAETVHVRQQFHKRRVTLPKSGKRRKVFLPPPAAQALRDLPSRVPNPLCSYSGTAMVFPGKLDQRITQSALSGYWKPVRIAFEAGLDPRRRQELRDSSDDGRAAFAFYALRHYCATFLTEEGVESWIVARQLGHEDGGRLVEKLYGHPRDEVARERMRRVFNQNVQPLRAVEAEEAAG